MKHLVRATIDIPMPPTMNGIWRSNHTGRNVYRSPAYKAWLQECQALCLANRWHKNSVAGPYEISITFNRRMCRAGSDLGNREKPVSDWLQAAGIIQNDNLAERIELKWGAAPAGCRVVIDQIEGESLPLREQGGG